MDLTPESIPRRTGFICVRLLLSRKTSATSRREKLCDTTTSFFTTSPLSESLNCVPQKRNFLNEMGALKNLPFIASSLIYVALKAVSVSSFLIHRGWVPNQNVFIFYLIIFHFSHPQICFRWKISIHKSPLLFLPTLQPIFLKNPQISWFFARLATAKIGCLLESQTPALPCNFC